MRIALLAFAARIFSVCAALVVAFLVTPTVFGLYGRLQMLGLVFTVFAFLRLERAIVAEPQLKEACRATKAGLWILPLTATAVALSSILLIPELATPWAANSDQSRSAPNFTIIALYFFALTGKALILLMHSWLSRWGLQGGISLLIFLQAMAQVIIQLSLLRAGTTPIIALILGEIAGCIFTVGLGAWRSKRVVEAVRAAENWSQSFRRQRHLPLMNLPAAVMSQLLVALPLLAFGRLADPVATGHLALAWRICEAPMQMLAATATTLAVTTGIWARKGILRNDKRKAAIYVALIAALAGTLILFANTVGLTTSDDRLVQTAAYVPIAAFITAAIAVGGPHADLVTFAGAEKAALLIHGLATLAAVTLCLIAGGAFALLVGLGVIILLRSVALWILLPIALGQRPALIRPKA